MRVNFILLTAGFLLMAVNYSTGQVRFSDPFTDTRDGQVYNTIVIGSQTWMDRNLNFNTPGSWCFNDKQALCDQEGYGRLYTFETAKNACPQGWHMPTIKEWQVLSSTISPNGDPEEIGIAIKVQSSWGFSPKDGMDKFGFRMRPAGMRDVSGRFHEYGASTAFWLPNGYQGEVEAVRVYKNNISDLMRGSVFPKETGLSVRCIKN